MKELYGPQTRGLRLTSRQELGTGGPELSHAQRQVHLHVELA